MVVHAHVAATDGGAIITERDLATCCTVSCPAGDGGDTGQVFGQLNLQAALVTVHADVLIGQFRTVSTAGDVQLFIQFLGDNRAVIAFELQAVVQGSHGVLIVAIFILVDDPGDAILAIDAGCALFRLDDGHGVAVFPILAGNADGAVFPILAVFADGDIVQAAMESVIDGLAGDELVSMAVSSICYFTGTDSFAPFILVRRLVICRCCAAIRILQILTNVGSIYVGFQRQFAVRSCAGIFDGFVDCCVHCITGDEVCIALFDFAIIIGRYSIGDGARLFIGCGAHGYPVPRCDFDGSLCQVLDHRLSGIGDVGQVLQVRNIGGIGCNVRCVVGNVRCIRMDLGIQGSQVRGRGICRFDIVAIGCRMGLRVHCAAGYQLLIAGSDGACADGFAPFFFVRRLFCCRCCIPIRAFQVLADVVSCHIRFQCQFGIRSAGFFGNHTVYIADVGSVVFIGVRIGSIRCGEAALDIGNLIVVYADIAAADGGFAIRPHCDFGTCRCAIAGCLVADGGDSLQVFSQFDRQAAGFINGGFCSIFIGGPCCYDADIVIAEIFTPGYAAADIQRMSCADGIQVCISFSRCCITCYGFGNITGELDAIVDIGNVVIACSGAVIHQPPLQGCGIIVHGAMDIVVIASILQVHIAQRTAYGFLVCICIAVIGYPKNQAPGIAGRCTIVIADTHGRAVDADMAA